jgi:hypothetical protein
MSHDKSKRPEDHRTTSPKHNGTQNESTKRHVYVEPGVEVDFVQDLKDRHNTEQRETTTHNKKQLLWTKVTAALVLIYAGLTWWQGCSTSTAARAARDAADVASRTMKTDQRAWMKINATQFGMPVKDAPYEANLTVVNTGKTPAHHVFLRTVVKIINNEEDMQFGYAPCISSITGAIFPSETSEPHTATTLELRNGEAVPKNLSSDEVNWLETGKTFLVIYSEVDYRDIFGTNHWSRMCAWANFSPSGASTARQCVAYNSVDDN